MLTKADLARALLALYDAADHSDTGLYHVVRSTEYGDFNRNALAAIIAGKEPVVLGRADKLELVMRRVAAKLKRASPPEEGGWSAREAEARELEEAIG